MHFFLHCVIIFTISYPFIHAATIIILNAFNLQFLFIFCVVREHWNLLYFMPREDVNSRAACLHFMHIPTFGSYLTFSQFKIILFRHVATPAFAHIYHHGLQRLERKKQTNATKFISSVCSKILYKDIFFFIAMVMNSLFPFLVNNRSENKTSDFGTKY